jgi:hypothetical protein
MYMRVVTWLLKDCHGNEIEVTGMNDWLGIRLMYMRVVTWLLKDYHGNEIGVTDMNDWLGIRLMYMRVGHGSPSVTMSLLSCTSV